MAHVIAGVRRDNNAIANDETVPIAMNSVQKIQSLSRTVKLSEN